MQAYNFDKVYLGSILIEFSDNKEQVLRRLVGLQALGEIEVGWDEEVGEVRRSRLKDKTGALPLLKRDGGSSGVLYVRLS